MRQSQPRVALVGLAADISAELGHLIGDAVRLLRAPDLAGALELTRDGNLDVVIVRAGRGVERLLVALRAAGVHAATMVIHDAADPGAAPVPMRLLDVGSQVTIDWGHLDGPGLRSLVLRTVASHRSAVGGGVQQLGRRRAPSASGLTDPLTGLPAGERLLEDVDQLVGNAVRFARPLSVAVVRADALASRAARPGLTQAELDDLQVRVAAEVREAFRTCDLVGRLGDGEFVVAMVSTTAAQAETAVRRMLDAVSVIEVPPGLELGVHAGICPLRGLATVEDLIVSAMSAADRAPVAEVQVTEALVTS